MATTKGIKLAITSEEEIKQLMDLCIEIEQFGKILNNQYFEGIGEEIKRDKGYFKILYPIYKSANGDIEEFMTEVFKEFDRVHFQRILFNCSTLLINCADLSIDHLDFNPDIKKGLELLEEKEKSPLTPKGGTLTS